MHTHIMLCDTATGLKRDLINTFGLRKCGIVVIIHVKPSPFRCYKSVVVTKDLVGE